MANTVPEKEYVESCLRVYTTRIERDIGNSRDLLTDFLEFLKVCGLEIRSKEHLERKEKEQCQRQT